MTNHEILPPDRDPDAEPADSVDAALDELAAILRAEQSADHPDFSRRKADLTRFLDEHRRGRQLTDKAITEAQVRGEEELSRAAGDAEEMLKHLHDYNDILDKNDPKVEAEKRQLAYSLQTCVMTLVQVTKTIERLAAQAHYAFKEADWNRLKEELAARKVPIKEGIKDIVSRLNLPAMKSLGDIEDFSQELAAKPQPLLRAALRDANDVLRRLLDQQDFISHALKQGHA